MLNEQYTKHFSINKYEIDKNTENWHYYPKLDVQVMCAASRSGIGAAIEQNTPDELESIAFASRSFNPTLERFSVDN